MKGVPPPKTVLYTKDLQLLPASAGMQMEQLQLQIQDTRYKRCCILSICSHVEESKERRRSQFIKVQMGLAGPALCCPQL